MSPSLSMALARLKVNDLLRGAAPRRRERRSPQSPGQAVGGHYRLAGGSWIHGRHDAA